MRGSKGVVSSYNYKGNLRQSQIDVFCCFYGCLWLAGLSNLVERFVLLSKSVNEGVSSLIIN